MLENVVGGLCILTRVDGYGDMPGQHDRQITDGPVFAVGRPDAYTTSDWVAFIHQVSCNASHLIGNLSPGVFRPLQVFRLAQVDLVGCFFFPPIEHFQR